MTRPAASVTGIGPADADYVNVNVNTHSTGTKLADFADFADFADLAETVAPSTSFAFRGHNISPLSGPIPARPDQALPDAHPTRATRVIRGTR